MSARSKPQIGRFERSAGLVGRWSGSTPAFVAALSGASNRLVNVEDLSEEELAQLHAHYSGLAELARKKHARKRVS